MYNIKYIVVVVGGGERWWWWEESKGIGFVGDSVLRQLNFSRAAFSAHSVGGRTFLEELCRSAGKTAGAGAAKLADQICHQK